MARKTPKKAASAAKAGRPIEQYEHAGKKRANNPHVGLVNATSDVDAGKRRYAYDPHLDPQLQWALPKSARFC